MTNLFLARIRQKAAANGKKFHPPLSVAEVVAFESQHGFTLPEDYRLFLTEIGNGGDGPPWCGLVHLGEIPADMEPESAEHWSSLDRVREPFPFVEDCFWEDETFTEELYESAWHGSIVLGHEGCGQYSFLIVTGPERGNIWQRADPGVHPLLPKRRFLQWVEDWLDGKLPET